MMKLLLCLILAAALQGLLAAQPRVKKDESAVLHCQGDAIVLSFYLRPEKLCIRWAPGATIETLSSALASFQGRELPVDIRTRRLRRWLRSRQRRITSSASLHSFRKVPLVASAKYEGSFWIHHVTRGYGVMLCSQDEHVRVPLDTHFVYALPTVGVANYPLLLLQTFRQNHDMHQLEMLLEDALPSTVTWIKRPDGNPVHVLQPSYHVLGRIFPTMTYRHVEFRDTEKGLLKYFQATFFSFPMKSSSYYCGAKIPVAISPLGKSQIKEALATVTEAEDMPVMLATRSPQNVNEQNPTLVLIQLLRGPRDTVIMKETAIHTEMQAAPVQTSQTPERFAGRGLLRNLVGGSRRLISRMAGAVAKISLSRCFVWKFSAMTNADLEEAFNLKKTLPEGSRGFRSMQEFFTRSINVEVLRPIDKNALVVSPADSVIQNAFFIEPNGEGEIVDAHVPQVKGTTFNLSDFLFGRGSNLELKLQDPRNKLHVQIYYLAPADYHRFHSSADWLATRHVYIPGCNPSVRRSVLLDGIVLDAFERTSVQGHWRPGNTNGPRLFFSMTFVGAMMVGGIELFYRRNLDSNKFSFNPSCGNFRKSLVYDYDEPVGLCMGQEMGSFRFGSTVVLVFEAPPEFETNTPICEHVDVNSTTGSIPGAPRRTLSRCNFTYGNYGSPVEYLQYLQGLRAEGGKPLGASEREASIETHIPSDAESNGELTGRGLIDIAEPSKTKLGMDDGEEEMGLDKASEMPPKASLNQETMGESARRLGEGLLDLTSPSGEENVPPNAFDDAAHTVMPAEEPAEPREEREPPQSFRVGQRPLKHRAITRQVPGQEVKEYSTVPNLDLKLRAIEYGLFYRFALAQWLAKAWTAQGEGSSRGSAILHVGQLGKDEIDSNAAAKPICYFDANTSSVLLRFAGHRSSLLLSWPAKKNDPVLLRYPHFACASDKTWGKASRGISATWKLSNGNLQVGFTLALTRMVEQNIGALETNTFSFIGMPRSAASMPIHAMEPEGETEISQVSKKAEPEFGILQFELAESTIQRDIVERFNVTETGVLSVDDSSILRSETSCFDSPIARFFFSPFRLLRLHRLRRQDDESAAHI